MGQQRPKITNEHIEQIRHMISFNPDWNRSRISLELCIAWDWQSPNGTYKDISCRDLLRDLDMAGLIKLPPPKVTGRKPGAGPEKVELIAHNTDDIAINLSALTPLKIEIAETKNDIKTFKSYIAQYHYLGWDRSSGENMKYIVKSRDGVPLACMMYGASAWKCRARDEYIGWDDEQRRAGLHLVTNNIRNLIFPWVQVPCFASHALAAISHRISGDWQKKYGHPIFLTETFVEQNRFRGISYRAANWVHVGETTGRGRNSKTMQPTLPVKDIYLLPLNRRWRECLLAERR